MKHLAWLLLFPTFAWGACDPLPDGSYPTTCARLSWTAPTQNTDGSPLTDLAGYRVYRDCGSGQSAVQDISSPATLTWDDETPPIPATCAYRLTAYNTALTESVQTNAVSKAFGVPGDTFTTYAWQIVQGPPPNMATLFEDLFDDGTDQVLTTHTPDTGTSWNNWNGEIRVNTVGNAYATSTTGNRANTNDLGVANYDIILRGCDLQGASTESRLFGGIARASANNVSDGLEFYYDDGADQWVVEEPDGTPSVSQAGAWPGDGLWMKFEVRSSGTHKLYYSTDSGSNWTLVITYTSSDPNPSTGKFAGLFMGNFGGGNALVLDSFLVQDVPTGGGANLLSLTGVGGN